MSDLDYELQQLRPLVGGTITGLIHNPPGPENMQTGSFGFRVRLTTGKHVNVWVDCDPEGNGPGHLAIEPDKINDPK